MDPRASSDEPGSSETSARQAAPAALDTRVTRLLGIRHPVIQGGMAWVADAHLAAAVSNAGGLGIIACGGASPAWVRSQILQARTLTDAPFGVNIMLLSPHVAELAQMVIDLQVPVVTTGAGSPSAHLESWKEASVKVLPVVASAALARRMQKMGADAVIAEGCEAGGHIGELTTMVLVPAVCDAVDIPVIAAGGVADGRGLAAAFALGAEGVQMGTRFLTARECNIHASYKDKVMAARDADTIVTGRLAGHPVRQLKNKFSRNAAAAEKDGSPLEEEMQLAGSLRRAVEGDVDMGSMMAGQSACLVSDEKPAADIVEEIVAQALARGGLSLQRMAQANATRTWAS